MRFGMPVFSGNLVCLGKIGRSGVIVLPACVGSDQLIGADLILDRLFSGEGVTSEAAALLDAGGLLNCSAAATPFATCSTAAE
jgi:hypothetical protein